MGSEHFIFIPLVTFAGMIIGFLFGVRAAKDAFNRERMREQEREAARAAREERKRKRREAQAADLASSGEVDDSSRTSATSPSD